MISKMNMTSTGNQPTNNLRFGKVVFRTDDPVFKEKKDEFIQGLETFQVAGMHGFKQTKVVYDTANKEKIDTLELQAYSRDPKDQEDFDNKVYSIASGFGIEKMDKMSNCEDLTKYGGIVKLTKYFIS